VLTIENACVIHKKYPDLISNVIVTPDSPLDPIFYAINTATQTVSFVELFSVSEPLCGQLLLKGTIDDTSWPLKWISKTE
jgi:hypothetical protein